MEAPSALLCHGVLGRLDSILAEDSVYGPNGWCNQHGGPYTSPAASHRHALDRRQDDHDDDDTIVDLDDHRRCAKSLLDDDTILKRHHFRILSSFHNQHPCQSQSAKVENDDGNVNSVLEASFSKEPSGKRANFHGPMAVSFSATTAAQNPPYSSSSPDVVLNESIMEELQDHLPLCKRGESFWLQYSLVRDGASLDLLLNKARDSEYTILAIETLEGEVFGAFCARPWKHSQDYYGSGQSFLWRVEGGVRTSCHNIENEELDLDDDEEDDLDVQVFKFAFRNHNIQLCQPDRLVIGGGDASHHSNPPPSLAASDSASTSSSTCSIGAVTHNPTTAGTAEWGFGLWLEQDLSRGSSSACLTFQSPPLSRIHADGSLFEIRNLEVWALTPCISVAQAEANQRRRRLLSGALVPRALSMHRHATTKASGTKV